MILTKALERNAELKILLWKESELKMEWCEKYKKERLKNIELERKIKKLKNTNRDLRGYIRYGKD